MTEHKNKVPLVEVEKKDPTGFANVLKGGLPRFIPVPAVRYVSEEMKVGKENPFGHLINTLFSRIPEACRAEIAEAASRVKQLMNRARERDRLPQIKEVEDLLKKQLCHFTECDIELEFFFPEVDDMFQGARIYVDDGIRTSVDAKGHGMQRSVIFSILRAYAELVSRGDASTSEKKRSILFAVEEPELYLHPQAQRTMMQVLREIANGEDQVVYSTHSSYFVDVAYFDEICLVRREKVDSHWRTAINQLSMSDLINDQRIRYPQTSPTSDSMRERYSHVYSATRSEGFFAKKIILVEGQTEEYAIPTYSQALEFDLDKEGVSVISSGGKGQIERLLRIFNEFKIPCYVVFDGDKHNKNAEIRKQTMALLDLLGHACSEPPPTMVERRFAVFEDEFENTIKSEVIGYSIIESQAKRDLGLKENSPLISRFIAKILVEKGRAEGEPSKYVPLTIKEIIERARELQWECSILRCS
jgi:putative ATP-dependent endonuclease of OLD family